MSRAWVLQVVPPGEGGVRDSALALAASWARQGTNSTLLMLTEAATRAMPLHRQVDSLCASAHHGVPLPACVRVLVQYSGYGYHPRGLCGWLPRQLAALRQHRPVRITVYFHELLASGPPWKSAFWLNGIQAHAARQMVEQADALWTNAESHAIWLRSCSQRGGNATPVVRPVFSTIGEPAAPSALLERSREMVVFGSQASRQRVAQALRRDSSVLKGLAVSGLVEAGSGTATLSAVAGTPTRFAGSLSRNEVSALLGRCRFGLIDYPAQLLAKSSVFAAYAAHRMAVVNLRHDVAPRSKTEMDGLAAGAHFLAATTIKPSPPDDAGLQALANASWGWYAPHRLASQAVEILQLVALRKP